MVQKKELHNIKNYKKNMRITKILNKRSGLKKINKIMFISIFRIDLIKWLANIYRSIQNFLKWCTSFATQGV